MTELKHKSILSEYEKNSGEYCVLFECHISGQASNVKGRWEAPYTCSEHPGAEWIGTMAD